jgi:hypothetical protein
MKQPRKTFASLSALVRAAALVALTLVASCGGGARAEQPTCDDECHDVIALRAVREQMKVIFNLTLQGKPVGAYDVTVPCPLGGRARIFGSATSNADQGSTFVDLTYVVEACTLLQEDQDPKKSYRLTLTGTLTQKGVLAVQPTSTSAVSIQSDALTVSGTVYEPPVPYEAAACVVRLGQNGSRISGDFCGRERTVDL